VRRIGSGAKLDHQLAIESRGNTCEGVDPRWSCPSLHPGDRGLRRPAELGQLALGDTPRFPPFRDTLRNQAEQLSIIVIDCAANRLSKRREAIV
jgi:hypothetical protein